MLQKLDITLHEWLHQQQTPHEIIGMIVQVLNIIHKLMDMNICHRDMKLDNLMARTLDEFEFCNQICKDSPKFWQTMRCYLIDFGLSNLKDTIIDTSNVEGNDLFFFSWWLVHRARQVLINLKIEGLFYDVLTIHESQIPPEILGKISCRRENGCVIFHEDILNTQEPANWDQKYGLSKELLYRLQDILRPDPTLLKRIACSLCSLLGHGGATDWAG